MDFSICFCSLRLRGFYGVCILSYLGSLSKAPRSADAGFFFEAVLFSCLIYSTDFPVGSIAEFFEIRHSLLAGEINIVLDMFGAFCSYFELSAYISNLACLKDISEMLFRFFVWVIESSNPVV